MAKNVSIKRALIASVLVICLSFASLIGTTFAWFTDSVTSSGNKIMSGSLKVDLELLDKDGSWSSIKEDKTALFNNENWEPGYTEVKMLKVENEGTLALKWKAKFVAEDELGILADVIDVYVRPYDVLTEEQANNVTYPATRDLEAEGYTKVGTVRDFVNTIETTTTGKLKAGEAAYLGIALKMQESAGNEYQDKDLGAFDIMILAAQLNSEEDSFGKDYDADAKYATIASSTEAFFAAIEKGDNVLLTKTLVIDDKFVDYMNESYPASTFALGSETETVDMDAVIDGNGITVYRTADLKDAPIFEVADGYTLALSNITLDGGAVWTGETDPVLLRGTVNSGMTTEGAIITTSKGHIVLNEGAVLQNNDGANAVFPGTRTGGTLTLNGGEIINNHSAAGAIWGGGAITINSGKVNGNHGGIGGAIRVVTNVGTVLTMNGGEMNHNYSDGNGGAIWAGSSPSNNVYVLNGGEMAYNYSAAVGGAMYAGYYETVKIGGTFKMHDNVAAGGANAIRFHNHAGLVMTGGEIYDNGDNSLFLLNNSASITGGTISDNFSYGGGLWFTLGEADIEGVVAFDLSTNHNTAYLAAEFSELKFKVNEADEHFAAFNFKPADDYTYTAGDEAKLICMNEGYETYWDAATGTFRLQAK